jgi:hypothetical protein
MALWGRLSSQLEGIYFDEVCADSHKDYLFQKRLAKVLPMDSFRFDFRYVHNSTTSNMLPEYTNGCDFSVGITRRQDIGALQRLRTTYKTYALWLRF